MRGGVAIFLFWVLFLCSGVVFSSEKEDFAAVVTEELRQSYRVTQGDEISISVFGEPDLSADLVRVGEDGRIRLPFIGDVDVSGLTVVEIERSISARLSDGYLVDPKVSMRVTRFRQVFIDGQVRSPGSFDFQPGLTVRKLVTLAGGLTERASTRRISIVSSSESITDKARRAKLDDLLRPGDQVTIEQSFF